MAARQYHKEMKALLETLREEGEKPSLLLHACCAPCASHPLSFLTEYFDVTVYYYNPNITDEAEQDKRYEEIARFLEAAHPRVGLVRGARDERRPRADCAVRAASTCGSVRRRVSRRKRATIISRRLSRCRP